MPTLKADPGRQVTPVRVIYGQKQMLTRKTVTEVLKWAAKDFGQVEANFASHSLRIGGASTMLACGYSEEYIRRQGLAVILLEAVRLR